MGEPPSPRIAAIGVVLTALAAAALVTAAIARADGGQGKQANSTEDEGVTAPAGVNANANVNANGGVRATNNTNANGGVGHTPVTICHWVPAHGGSYITITIDDD